MVYSIEQQNGGGGGGVRSGSELRFQSYYSILFSLLVDSFFCVGAAAPELIGQFISIRF